MHILFTIANDSYVPYFNWFARKALDYPKIKFSFLCLYPERPRMIDDMKAFGCDVYWVKFNELKRKSSIICAIPKVYKILKKIKPDAVHSHLFDDALISLIAAKLASVKIRAITKGDACYHYFYARKWMIFDKINNFLATHIVAVSSENKRFILDKEVAEKNKVSLIHHGIPKEDYFRFNNERILEIKKKFNLDECFVFGSIGRLEKNKGMMDVAKAAKKLNQLTDIKFKVLIVGEGKEKEALLRYVSKNNLEDKVCLTGWINEEDIPNLYACLDAYVHASHFETFGFVIAESMMYGLPIVATITSGAAKDAVRSIRQGFLFEYGDIGACAAGMHNLILSGERHYDEIQKKALEMYEFSVMWNKHISLYKDSLSVI